MPSAVVPKFAQSKGSAKNTIIIMIITLWMVLLIETITQGNAAKEFLVCVALVLRGGKQVMTTIACCIVSPQHRVSYRIVSYILLCFAVLFFVISIAFFADAFL